MSNPSLPPCDVVIAPNRSVYVNGTLITNVSDLDVNFGNGNPVPVITMEFVPTSIVYGDIPTDTLDAAAFDMHPDDGTVNISRAIARAQARAAGLDPVRHVQPAPTPSAVPAPVRKASAKAAEAKEEEYPVEDDSCGESVPGEAKYVTCKRSYGHPGSHRTYR